MVLHVIDENTEENIGIKFTEGENENDLLKKLHSFTPPGSSKKFDTGRHSGP